MRDRAIMEETRRAQPVGRGLEKKSAEDLARLSEPSAPESARFEQFADALRGDGRTEKTIASYRCDWHGIVRWYGETHGKSFELTDLDGPTLKAFRDAMGEAGQRASTINRKLVFAKRYAAWGVDLGEIDSLTEAAIRKVNSVDQAPRRPRGFSDIEQRRLIRYIDDDASIRDRAIVHLLLGSGIRVGELVELDLTDVTFNQRGGRLGLPDGRSVKFGMRVSRAVRLWIRARGRAEGPLFTGERGPLTANGVQRVVRNCCREAGIEGTPSTLRHTFAQNYLERDTATISRLAQVLGHGRLDSTRLYLEADHA